MADIPARHWRLISLGGFCCDLLIPPRRMLSLWNELASVTEQWGGCQHSGYSRPQRNCSYDYYYIYAVYTSQPQNEKVIRIPRI